MQIQNEHEDTLNSSALLHLAMQKLEYSHKLKRHTIHMMNSMKPLMENIFEYYEKHGLEIPNREEIDRILLELRQVGLDMMKREKEIGLRK